jgi:hypothetical protein
VTGAAPKPVASRCHCGLRGVFGYWVRSRLQWFCDEHRLRQWSADVCVDEIAAKRASAKLIEVENVAPPDLQKLVVRHGGYDKISAKAWAEYDRQMEVYETKRRERYRRR